MLWTGLTHAETPVYTVADCIRIGQERSAVALNAARDVQIGSALVQQARADALPQLSLSATYRRLDELTEIDLGGGEAAEFGTLDNYSVLAEIDQTLYAGGRVRAALHGARLSREYYHESERGTRSALTRDIRTGFNAIILNREAVTVHEEAVAQLESHAGETETRYRAGTVSEFDWLSANVRVANAQPDLIAARNAYRVARVDFRRLLDLEDAEFELDGELVCRPVSETLADLLVRATEGRPEVRAMETMALLRRTDMAATRSTGLPSLRAFFTYNGANSYQFVSFDDEWEWHWNAGLTAEWDVWDGGLTAARVREKRLLWEKALTDLDEWLQTVRLQVRTAYLEMERALESVRAGEGSIELAGRALGIALARVDAGFGTHLEFADSQLALSRSRLARLQALHDHMNAVAWLEYACGLEPGALTEEETEP